MPHLFQTNQLDADRQSQLVASRRVDWRFLLPDPRLRRVALVGQGRPGLREALELLSEESVDAADSPDLVVVSGAGAGLDALRHAAELVPSGGHIYAELAPLAGHTRAFALLKRLGFGELRAHWHLPGFDRCEEIVPLAGEEVVRHALGRRGPRVRIPGRVLFASGLLGRVSPWVSVLGRRLDAGSGHPPVNAGLSRLAAAGVDFPAETRSLLVTPRFATSRHVVFLFFQPGDDRPWLVAKLPRLPADVEGIEREAAGLRELGRLGSSFDGAPRLVAFEREPGGALLAETAVSGAPMAPAEIRRAPDRCVSSVAGLLTEMALADPRAASADPGWYERLLGEPLRRFAAAFEGGDEARLVERTLELVAPLREGEIPLVLEHGDVSHPNILLLADGRAALVDWELSELRGLPAHDLFLFLAYVVFALGRARTNDRRKAVFHETFFGARAPYSETILAYAERVGVLPRFLPALFVACWARYAAALVARLRTVGGEGTAPSASLRAHRNYVLWRHTVENAGQLRLSGEEEGS